MTQAVWLFSTFMNTTSAASAALQIARLSGRIPAIPVAGIVSQQTLAASYCPFLADNKFA